VKFYVAEVEWCALAIRISNEIVVKWIVSVQTITGRGGWLCLGSQHERMRRTKRFIAGIKAIAFGVVGVG